MIVTHDGVWYWAHTEYADRERVKNAGFLWDPILRKWKTKFPARAAALRPYCDDGALAALASHFEKLEASRATDSKIEVPAPAGLTYLPYQKAGIAYATGRAATLLADSPGLGKSIQTLGVVNNSPTMGRVLVVCPASLKLNWQKEARKWLVRQSHVEVISKGKWTAPTNSGDAPDAGKELHFVIVGYERMTMLEAELAKIQWDLVIIDEAHYIKSVDAKRSKAAYRLCQAAKSKLLLTGTPLLNKPVELLPLAGLCDQDRFGDPLAKRDPRRWAFLKRYCGAHQEWRPGAGNVWVFDGATHLDELQERLRSSIMIRRLKEEVLPELPAKRRQVVPLDVQLKSGAEAMTWWENLQAAEAEAALAAVERDKTAYAEAAGKLKYLNAVAFTEMAEYRHRLGLAKVEEGSKYVQDLMDGGVDKIVVFAHHRDVLEQLRAKFEEAELSPVLLYGGMNDRQKDDAVLRFQGGTRDGVAVPHDPSCRVFLGQIQAAGTGLTLTVASHVVFVEIDWVPATTTQAEDRLHRITQKDIVFVHHLIVDDTLDAHMVKKVVRKQEIADQALDLEPEYEEAGALAEAPPNRETAIRKVPVERRMLLKRALQHLANRCDGAQAKDEAGFNGMDSAFGKKLAALPDLTDGQFYAGWKLIRKYKNTQLPRKYVVGLELDKSPEKEAA